MTKSREGRDYTKIPEALTQTALTSQLSQFLAGHSGLAPRYRGQSVAHAFV